MRAYVKSTIRAPKPKKLGMKRWGHQRQSKYAAAQRRLQAKEARTEAKRLTRREAAEALGE